MERESSTKAKQDGWLPSMASGWVQLSKIEWSIDFLMATWCTLLVTGDQHIWAKEGRALIKNLFPEGMWALVNRPTSLPRKNLGQRWSRILQAWWNMDPKVAEPSHQEEMLAWPVIIKNCKWSRYHPIVYDRVIFDKPMGKWRLRTPDELQVKTPTAKTQAIKELVALRLGKAWEGTRIGCSLQQIPKAFPKPAKLAKLPNLELAGLPIDLVTSQALRIWRRDQATSKISADLQNRNIGKNVDILENVWQWVHHPIKSKQVQEIHYKLVFNALPLASRTRFFTGSDQCYACPGVTQDIEHFASSCWIAQELWKTVREVESKFSKDNSWMTTTSHHLFGEVQWADLTFTKERRLFLHGTGLETVHC